MFLTHEEVCELTGSKLKAGQIANLRQNGIRHTIKHSGWPAVTKEAIIHTRSSTAERPNWKPKKAS